MNIGRVRHLYIILGDQLDERLLRDLDAEQDAVWMAEVDSEATHVWCHKQRLLLFLSAMRHFRDGLTARGVDVRYRELSPRRRRGEPPDHARALTSDLREFQPEEIILTRPGDWRILKSLSEALDGSGLRWSLREEEDHFYASLEEFAQWAKGRKNLVLEHWYRHLRRREGILIEDGQPVGGAWNFDAANRKSFGKKGPPPIAPLPGHTWDDRTREVATLVEARYADHPGDLESFSLPVTRGEALTWAEHFIQHGLPRFGPHQDAMWGEDVVLWHSRLSAPLNLKLIHPRELVEAALKAHDEGRADIESVEGFIRQILGWREFIRGIYWTRMPEYAESNALECEDRRVPSFFWTGETDMSCVAASMRGLIRHGYVHHIHRLMVLGLFSQQLGVHPYRFHEWHMAMYLDAVDWVSLPNALGMSQFGDGGVVGSKPYAATGKYIKRMSNYCGACRYRPDEATGDQACPFTTLYWDFLDRHRDRLATNQRMTLQLKNVQRKDETTLEDIRARARWLRDRIDAEERI